MAPRRSMLSGGSYNPGTGNDPLSPTDIARPGVAGDPGVTMRPAAPQLGNPTDPRGPALAASAKMQGQAIDAMALAQRSFSRDMLAVGTAFAELAKQRQKAEDDIAIDQRQ